MSIAQSSMATAPKTEVKENAEKKVSFTIDRLIWGSAKSREYQVGLSSRPLAAKKLNVFLKNPQYQVFGLTDETKRPLAYFAVITTMGVDTLILHHAEEVKPKCLNKMALMVLLDHVGCDFGMAIGSSPETVLLYKRVGFIRVENNWQLHTAAYRNLPVDKRIHDISGLEMLTDTQNEQLLSLVRYTLYREGQCDPLEREIFREILPEEIIERARNANYRTLVWMEAGDILGVIQLQYAEWGEVIISGVGVDGSHTGKRIGRNLIAAAIAAAGKSHETIMATTFVNNAPMEHLLANIFQWECLPASYGIERSIDAISWKKSKLYKGSSAGHGNPTYAGD